MPARQFPSTVRGAGHQLRARRRFDPKKLLHVNAEHLRAHSVDEFTELSRPFIIEAPWADRYDSKVFIELAPEVQTRVETLAEVPGYVDFLFMADPEIVEADWDKAMVPDAPAWLDAVIDGLAEWDFDAENLHERTFALAEELGANRRKFQAPIRVALTGRRVGPPLFESMALLGRDEVLRRLRAARARLGDVPTADRGWQPLRAAPVRGTGVRTWCWSRPLWLVGYALWAVVGVVVAASADERAATGAIVVLGAAQYDGTPSPVLQARLDHALELYEQGVAPEIVLTGSKQEADRFTEAYAGFTYLLGRGSARGGHGRGHRRRRRRMSPWSATARVLSGRASTTVTLVSDGYHNRRLKGIASELGLDATCLASTSGLTVDRVAQESAVGRAAGS